MKVTGSATIGHPIDAVYVALTSPAVLVRTLPGCQRLEQTGPDSYQATLEAGVGSIKGLFDGAVRLADQAFPDSFTLHASGAGTPGTVDAVAHVRLAADPVSGGTLVHYVADATVGGVIGGVGQRMLAGVARRTAGEFFTTVDRVLTASTLSPAVAAPATIATAIDAEQSVAAVESPAAVAVEPAPRVWTRPAPVRDPERQRTREMVVAAAFGAVIALLGVLLGAIVARW